LTFGIASFDDLAWRSRDSGGRGTVLQIMLQGPYRRRPRTLREHLMRIGVAGWLWVAAVVLAAIVLALYLS
jgi:hypothetical protein